MAKHEEEKEAPSLWDNFLDSAQVSLSRRIDNELNKDFLPSPNQASNEAPLTKTANDQTGRAKQSGTGGQMLAGVPNVALIGGGLVIAGLVIFLAVK